jgi:hypothetical protein
MKGLKTVLTKFLGAMGCCLIALGCGETTEEDTPHTNAGAIDAGLDHLKPLLQELRSLDIDIARAVPADSVSSDVIVPLIKSRFRPKLIALSNRVQEIVPAPELATVHIHLREYLRLRLEAFDLAVEGARLNDSALFEQFGARLTEADDAGRALKNALNAVRYDRSGF